MALSLLMPWELRRAFLEKQFGFRIHPTCRIGLSWIFPTQLIMEEGAQIAHLTVCKGLDLLHLKAHALIGRGNWITGFPLGTSAHFASETDRKPQLVIGEHSAITHRHLIDCTNSVTIGSFTTFAGFQSQILTHSIDIAESRQRSAPVTIGSYCFIGGAVVPDFCVVGAKSLVNKPLTETHTLYGGVPARAVQKLSPDAAYFHRTQGFVV